MRLAILLAAVLVAAPIAGAAPKSAACDGCPGYLVRAFPDGRQAYNLVAAGDEGYFQDISPDVTRVLFTRQNGDLYVETMGGRDVRRIAALQPAEYQRLNVTFSPDGRDVSYVRSNATPCDDQLTVVSTAGIRGPPSGLWSHVTGLVARRDPGRVRPGRQRHRRSRRRNRAAEGDVEPLRHRAAGLVASR